MEIERAQANDVDRIVEAMGRFFPGFTLRARTEVPLTLHLEGHVAHGISLIAHRLSGAQVRAKTESLGFGAADVHIDGAVMSEHGPISTHQPFALPVRTSAAFDSVQARVLRLDDEAMLRYARADLGDDGFMLRPLGAVPTSAAAARIWSATAKHAHDQMQTGAADIPLIGAALEQLLIAAYLNAFPTTWAEADDPPDVASAAPAAVRRAMAFIEENAHRAVTVAAISEAAHMSVRGLQSAFARATDQTPMQYLRLVRLEYAHQDLLASDPAGGETVHSIAVRWGFSHAGRFAGEYRRRYGEHPSSTLRG